MGPPSSLLSGSGSYQGFPSAFPGPRQRHSLACDSIESTSFILNIGVDVRLGITMTMKMSKYENASKQALNFIQLKEVRFHANRIF